MKEYLEDAGIAYRLLDAELYNIHLLSGGTYEPAIGTMRMFVSKPAMEHMVESSAENFIIQKLSGKRFTEPHF